MGDLATRRLRNDTSVSVHSTKRALLAIKFDQEEKTTRTECDVLHASTAHATYVDPHPTENRHTLHKHISGAA
eukprot:SAG31_NODE_34220_length_335_cov_0.872881_2_plen_72_part_01